ncbi:unnamed protein product [Penicillium salamii]|nr:unnamed protein product [Penicillium salamii]
MLRCTLPSIVADFMRLMHPAFTMLSHITSPPPSHHHGRLVSLAFLLRFNILTSYPDHSNLQQQHAPSMLPLQRALHLAVHPIPTTQQHASCIFAFYFIFYFTIHRRPSNFNINIHNLFNINNCFNIHNIHNNHHNFNIHNLFNINNCFNIHNIHNNHHNFNIHNIHNNHHNFNIHNFNNNHHFFNIHNFNIHNFNIHNFNIHNFNIHNFNIHNFNIHNFNIHNFNIHNFNIHNFNIHNFNNNHHFFNFFNFFNIHNIHNFINIHNTWDWIPDSVPAISHNFLLAISTSRDISHPCPFVPEELMILPPTSLSTTPCPVRIPAQRVSGTPLPTPGRVENYASLCAGLE